LRGILEEEIQNSAYRFHLNNPHMGQTIAKDTKTEPGCELLPKIQIL
jgi:hypothetical protein